MKANKSTVFTIAEKCKNILASNWQGILNTIKTDSKGSKPEFYSSRVKYLLNKGKPYIWIPEKDLHNVNTIIDDRASFAVPTPYPGPLANLLKSMNKLPERVAMTGEIVHVADKKIESATEKVREMVFSEQKQIAESSYAVSGILSSATFGSTSRSENLVELLDSDDKYVVYKFNASSCMFIDGNGGSCEVDPEEFRKSKADTLSPFAAKLIDGINQSEIRRRALVVLSFAFLNVDSKDAYVLSVDRKGLNMLARVVRSGEYQWKELRLTFDEDAENVESFCSKLVQMEEAALDKLKSCSGLR
ncbi:unnamed protein product [Amaranthus hypochondriacus]